MGKQNQAWKQASNLHQEISAFKIPTFSYHVQNQLQNKQRV